MGCSSCGTTGSAGGKVSGCQSNGGCSTGSCNRMNAYDWLANLPFSSADSACRVVEISFNNGSRKDYFRNSTVHVYEKGDMVTVEGISGFDVGEISLTGEVVRIQLKKKGIQEHDVEMKKLLRRSTEKDLELLQQNKSREKEAIIRARAIARQFNLNMKVSEVEIQADGRKATFFYIADDRVDFRELIKIYAKEFKVKVEMRQIGARQEAAKVGGIGSCGRELCCSTWLTDFKSVNTTAARYQNLSINQSKLSGQCGRLKCCLNYELDTYLDALQDFPDNADTVQVAKGTAILIKKDIFKNLMWYILPDSSKQYPLSIERVKKIKQLNQKGEIPAELEPADLTPKAREIEPEYADLVGQISLKSLEKAEKKKKYSGAGPQGKPPQQQRSPQQEQQKPAQQSQQRPPQQQRTPQQGQRPPQQQGQRPPIQKGNQAGTPQQRPSSQPKPGQQNQPRPPHQKPGQQPQKPPHLQQRPNPQANQPPNQPG
ncbi:MAG TPA: regulatory iron-sulfur-containing complex subunit RicT, partial [Flavitalea sp.]|nr:regulatory iron-sulfur-containing complex subunit RicT [Flavitalea sp.]